MIEIFFCLVLHTQCSILVSKASNEIRNSTSTFESVVLQADNQSPFFIVQSSTITISRSELVTSIPLISSTSSSFILLSSITLKHSPSSLIESSYDRITLEHTSITNVAIPGTEVTFLSSGYARIQRVADCQFLNVSHGVESKREKEERWGVSEEGVMKDSLMERCEDSFYGFIITGPTVMTLNEFECMNSSFVECVRGRDPPKRLPISIQRRLSSAGTCDTSTTEDCTTSTGIRSTSSMTFKNAIFTDCASQTVGGGIFLDAKSSALTLVSCSFTRCTASDSFDQGGGGAVEVDYGTLSASSSNFTSCSSKTYGGAIYLYYTSDSMPSGNSITSCIFCENSAEKGASDVCIYYKSEPTDNIIDDTSITYNSAEYTTGYWYKSGQGPSASWVYTNQQWMTKGGSFCPQPPVDDVDGIIKYPHLTHFIRHHL